jgi:Mg-chelatase subunit ChlD
MGATAGTSASGVDQGGIAPDSEGVSDSGLVDRKPTTSVANGVGAAVAGDSPTDSKHAGRSDPVSDDREASEARDDAALAKETTKTAHSFQTLAEINGPSAPPSEQAELSNENSGTIDFFGVEGEGSTIVYVIDMSGSMAGYRFDKARTELVESVRRLNEEQSFCILLFNEQLAAPMGAILIRATMDAKSRVEGALEETQAHGGTDPTSAIEKAIELGPDVIYVLSDGEFEPCVVSAVAKRNRESGVVINTIGFQVDPATLRKVASDNGGEYRHIP